MVPGFLGYICGIGSNTSKNIKEFAKEHPLHLFLNSAFFVAGFTLGFAAIGILLSGILAFASFELRIWLSRVGGLLIIFFGLFILGIIKIPFLQQEHKLKPMQTKYQYLTSAIFGLTFAVGWSPCVGAVLGSILTLAATDPTGAFLPMVAYAIGLGIPFLLIGALGSQAVELLRNFRSFLPYFNLISGILLIILGVLVATQQLEQLASLVLPAQLLPFLNG
ncbi:MAG: cytochrome c biogenesis protein CcdA, partial [Candidatus Micrarchaeota archaeon]